MNISNIHNCYGCGVCSMACGQKIISVQLNHNGFYEPTIIEQDKCIDCSACINVCSYISDGLAQNNMIIGSYAAWSKDDDIRRKCSSGGAVYEVAKELINNGYKVCGVKYNIDKNRAEHYIASTLEELTHSIGSKYIQSYTLDGFEKINKKQKYLITGTPCQIDSFRRFVQRHHCEDNFVLLDFFCHGIPSKLLWDKYIAKHLKIIGKLKNVEWRNKQWGWHDSWAIKMNGTSLSGIVDSRLSQGDLFYKLFLGDICLGKQCYDKCKYKFKQSSADIRVGDLWGNAYKDDENGVSAVVTFTKKGDRIFQMSNLMVVRHPFDIIAEGQMKQSAVRPRFLNLNYFLLRSRLGLLQFNKLVNIERKIERGLKIINL